MAAGTERAPFLNWKLEAESALVVGVIFGGFKVHAVKHTSSNKAINPNPVLKILSMGIKGSST